MKLVNHEFVGSTIHYYFEDGIELVVENWGNGSKFWFHMEKRHRLDGPATERANGNKEWWQMGLRHRLDGPAIERADGSKAWYIEGFRYSEQDFNQKVNRGKNGIP